MSTEKINTKVIVIGDTSVGKTTLLLTIMGENDSGPAQPTVQAGFIMKEFEYDDKIIKMNIWDTAGQERFKSSTNQYIRGSSVAVICFTDETEAGVQEWINDVHELEPNCNIILNMTKRDLYPDELITRKLDEYNNKRLNDRNYSVMLFTSAKTSYGVEQLLLEIAKLAKPAISTGITFEERESAGANTNGLCC